MKGESFVRGVSFLRDICDLSSTSNHGSRRYLECPSGPAMMDLIRNLHDNAGNQKNAGGRRCAIAGSVDKPIHEQQREEAVLWRTYRDLVKARPVTGEKPFSPS